MSSSRVYSFLLILLSFGCWTKNRGKTPKIIHFNRVFHYKPSILGFSYFWKHPFPRCPHTPHLFNTEPRGVWSISVFPLCLELHQQRDFIGQGLQGEEVPKCSMSSAQPRQTPQNLLFKTIMGSCVFPRMNRKNRYLPKKIKTWTPICTPIPIHTWMNAPSWTGAEPGASKCFGQLAVTRFNANNLSKGC